MLKKLLISTRGKQKVSAISTTDFELKENSNSFVLIFDNLKIGTLSYCEDTKLWSFKYSTQFKEKRNKLNLIVGFPDINKEYKSETLWPFFNIRIPGLKQPKVKEILLKEDINPDDNVKLLKRFGQKSISNPFELIVSNG